MKMSTKGRYAVMAMIDIAAHSHGEPVSLAEIAERQDISQEYLEQLFGKLRKAGLVDSARGPGGGYRLARAAGDTPISDIILAADEELQLTRCDGDAVEGCVKGERCNAHDLWSSLGRQMIEFPVLDLARRRGGKAQPGAGRLDQADQGPPCEARDEVVCVRTYLDHNATSPASRLLRRRRCCAPWN